MNRTANQVHSGTPHLSVSDPRGLPVRQVEYLRTVADEPAVPLITRQYYDAGGRLIEQWDPRLFGNAARPNLATVYTLTGEPLRIAGVDAGTLLVLPGLAGQELHRWDARSNHWRFTYDELLRAVAIEENGVPNVETSTYADASDDAMHNRRGQLIAITDPSGKALFESFALALAGQPLRESRTFDDEVALVSLRTFNALGAQLEQTDAAGHRQQSTYDVAGQLSQVQLQLKGQTTWQPVQQQAQYNANGQIVEQLMGNNVTCRWFYDAADGRLLQQTAHKGTGAVAQDFEYEYDPMGNITAIVDNTFTPRFFANQRIDGRREFTHDSLYRLTGATGNADAPPADNPGRPHPTDPNDRRNYRETYVYDTGNNLIKTTHVRDGASHTRQMFIDRESNRGVRWKNDDPEPDFDSLYDPAGNLRALQKGQDLQWNTRGQLASAVLVKRDSGPDDIEHYRYSQGIRVGKRHETHSSRATHFHDVRYLPGLEIRTRDNGEILHVIQVEMASGSLRCLHWEAGKPPEIDADQLRYSLNDHLQSSVMEIDQQARLISYEGYLAFGETAWLTAASNVEVSYKTVRYSDKEMDESGLYYYGARYYAPWLGRWISADPEGPVDGLNLFGFVLNNPLRYVDSTGNGAEEILNHLTANTPRDRLRRQANFHFTLLESVSLGVRDIEQQLLNHRTGNLSGAASTAKRTGFFLAEKGVSFGVGIGLTAAGAAIGIPGGPLGMVIMGAVGFGASKALGATTKAIGREAGLNTSVSLQPDRLKGDKLLKQTRDDTGPLVDFKALKAYDPRKIEGRELLKKQGLDTGKDIALAAAGKIPYAGTAIKAIPGVIDIVKEVNAIGQDLSQEQIEALDTDISALIDLLQGGSQRLVERATEAGETKLLGRSLERVGQKTAKRIEELRDLRTVLHSKSARFTAV